ncbi:MAG: hypothetical protein J0647_11720 [Campylobacteraceae bacterium]|nr:hypothetical protein [Campylobacteraceae bacterium]
MKKALLTLTFANAQASVTETSTLSISDTKIFRSEESNGHFYVALKYDNLPLSIKLAKRGGELLCGTPTHPYLARTPILINLFDMVVINNPLSQP